MNDVSANGKPDSRSGTIGARILTSVVLATVYGFSIYLGWPYFNAAITAALGLMAWEWGRFSGKPMRAPDILLIGVVLACCVLATLGLFGWAIAAALAGAAAVYLAALFTHRGYAGWLAMGAVYLGVPVTALFWLLTGDGDGRLFVFWLVASVAATDIGAYFVGRAVGGPKLAPRLSPNKTWAGLSGGIVCAALAGAVYAYVADAWLVWSWVLAGAGVGLAAQAGDLFESLAKRRFRVKDASHILPGHGGFLDRADGLVAASFVVAGVKIGSGIAG